MNKFTLLTDEQTFGSKKIEVIKKIGTKCSVSDFAILLGSTFNDKYHIDNDDSLKGRLVVGTYLPLIVVVMCVMLR